MNGMSSSTSLKLAADSRANSLTESVALGSFSYIRMGPCITYSASESEKKSLSADLRIKQCPAHDGI